MATPIPPLSAPPLTASSSQEAAMLDYALSSPPPAASLAAAPASAAASVLSSPSALWPSSLPSGSAADALRVLTDSFPSVGEELAWRTLCLHNGDMASASAALTTLADLVRAAEALQGAFVSAPEHAISSAITDHAGDLSAAYVFLSNSYVSSWDPGHTPARLLASCTLPSSPPAPEFTSSDPFLADAKVTWWMSLLNSKQARLPASSPSRDRWGPMAQSCCSARAVSPRFSHFVYCLGDWRLSPNAYADALASLRALPSYQRAAAHIVSHGLVSAALDILPILLDEGLIHPGAAAWLAVSTETNPPLRESLRHFFLAFPLKSASVWNNRNLFLHSFADARAASRVVVPGASNDGASLFWDESAANHPSETALVSPTVTRARSGSLAPYLIADPGRIVQAPKTPDVSLVDKNGKPLSGAALLAVEKKLAKTAAVTVGKAPPADWQAPVRPKAKAKAKGTAHSKGAVRLVRGASEIIAEETDAAIRSLADSRHAISAAMAALSTPPPAPADPRFVPLESP